MASLAEILREQPDKITFDGGKPPVIGDVPPHTYGMLLEVDHLELLDEPEVTLDEMMIEDATYVLSREEELRKELQSISTIHNIPVTGIIEKTGQTIAFEFRPPVVLTSEGSSQENDPTKKHPLPTNKKNHDDNMSIFSGRMGKNVFENGVVVNHRN